MLEQETHASLANGYAPPEAAPVLTCQNCDAELAGPFCARCGQRRVLEIPTLPEFLRAATRELVNWDGRVPATLRTLFTKPGLLTIEFLEGRRARWLPPLRVYLICSLAYFLSGPIVESITHRSAREVARITVTNADGSTTLTPQAIAEIESTFMGRAFGRERILRAAANSQQLNREIATSMPKAMFLLLPLFAFFTRLAWRRKIPQYPAHIYPALHLHSAWFGAITVAAVAIPFVENAVVMAIIGLTAWTYVVWYGLVALRRIFGDSWGRTIAKALAISAAYTASLAMVSLLLLAYAVWSM